MVFFDKNLDLNQVFDFLNLNLKFQSKNVSKGRNPLYYTLCSILTGFKAKKRQNLFIFFSDFNHATLIFEKNH